jgi:23S rRNA C2498 (ribose-2'-O)-methylase RlmM
MEEECVIHVEDECALHKKPIPTFCPTNFTHAVSAVEFTSAGQKYIGWAVMEGKDVYVKPGTNDKSQDKTCRAFYKLYEALHRFNLPVEQGMKAVDVGASPGGWTECLVERGCQVFSIDPGKLTLSEEIMKNVVWLDGLSSSEKVLTRLGAEAPFDIVVCDMNQMPDELARCLDDMVPFLREGGLMVVTIKLSHLRAEQRYVRRYSKGSNRMIQYFLKKHPVELVGMKWLLQNKNERCVVFKKKVAAN